MSTTRRDPDNPPIPSEAFDRAVRIPDGADAATVRAALNAAKRRGRGPQKAPTKTAVSVRLDPTVLAHYRASGRGWQTRLNADLARLVARRTNANGARRRGKPRAAER